MLNQIPQPRRQPLFTPVQMGKLRLPNWIIMAPLTRMRAANPRHAPTELHAEYLCVRTERVHRLSHIDKNSVPSKVAVKNRLVVVQEFTSWYHQKGTLKKPTIALMQEPDSDT